MDLAIAIIVWVAWIETIRPEEVQCKTQSNYLCSDS